MSIVIIGIDIGGSTTDIVGLEKGQWHSPLTVQADDPVSSASGALGRWLHETGRLLSDIVSVAVTGVGAGALGDSLLGLPLSTVNEFEAVGRGGVGLTGLSRAIVASLGTGTAVVEVEEGRIAHWGGTGVGGGTLIGLSKALFGVSDVDLISQKAVEGRLDRVDLSVGDIATVELPGLPPDTTAANFGKMSDDVTDADLAMAVINLVCQTVGLIAAGAAAATGKNVIVLTGKLTTLPQAAMVFESLSRLKGLEYRIAPNAAFATALGAALTLSES